MPVSASLSVGTPAQVITVGFDSRSTSLVLNTFGGAYSPVDSMTSNPFDVFRYREPSNNNLAGKYYSDRFCFANQGVLLSQAPAAPAVQQPFKLFATSSSKAPVVSSSSSAPVVKPNTTNTTNTTTNTTVPPVVPVVQSPCINNQTIFGVEINQGANFTFSGNVGLGNGPTPRGVGVLAEFGNEWSFYSSPFVTTGSSLVLGAANKALMKGDFIG
jgi:hypothetical protein